MIVRDEAHCIARALRSVRPFISSYSISVDSRTTDDTAGVIHRELEGIPGVLQCDKWVDFATNRNLAMSRATGTHCLTLDADEILQGQIAFESDFDGYQIRLGEDNNNIQYWSTRLVKNDGQWQWRGVIHETLHHDAPSLAQLQLCHIDTPHDGARDIAGNKHEELLAIYESMQEPDAHDLFHWAQALYGAGRIDEAIKKYSDCAKIGDWDERTYYAAYRAGVLIATRETTQAKNEARDADLGKAISVLLKAASFRPSRYEALVWACMLLRKCGEHQKAYDLSAVAPKPSDDVIFVERDAEWRILEEHALASFHLGYTVEAAAYFENVLQYDLLPVHRERIEGNMQKCKGVTA